MEKVVTPNHTERAQNAFKRLSRRSLSTENMSIRRSLTNRLSVRFSHRPASRITPDDISLPIELISSTNPASYDAPDIATLKKSGFQNHQPDFYSQPYCALMGHTARVSLENLKTTTPVTITSKATSAAGGEDSTPNLTDASSVESFYSSSPRHSDQTPTFHTPPSSVPDEDSPAVKQAPPIPRRLPSHSKREHERLSRARSLRLSTTEAMADWNFQRTAIPTPSSSQDADDEEYFQQPSPRHPFGKELAKLSEVAEEYSSSSDALQKHIDKAYINDQNLGTFDANDYIAEISP